MRGPVLGLITLCTETETRAPRSMVDSKLGYHPIDLTAKIAHSMNYLNPLPLTNSAGMQRELINARCDKNCEHRGYGWEHVKGM